MVEGLQWGLQGHVSSAARKRETAGTWGTSSGPQGGGGPLASRKGWERVPFATPASRRTPFPLERRGLSVPQGSWLRDLSGLFLWDPAAPVPC